MADSRQRKFIPAASHDFFLPLYDPVLRLMGAERAQKELIAQAKIARDHRVLDLGCGTGALVLLLKRQYPELQIIGLDPDPKALQRARQKARRESFAAHFDQGFGDALPYEDDTFDRVVSSFMFHHLEGDERRQTMQEVSRVLKPGGSFHLLDFTSDEHGSSGFWRRLVDSHAQTKHNTDAQLLQLMRCAGFSSETKVKEGNMLLGLMRTTYYQATV